MFLYPSFFFPSVIFFLKSKAESFSNEEIRFFRNFFSDLFNERKSVFLLLNRKIPQNEIEMSSLTDFSSRSEILDEFCSADFQRRNELILSSKDFSEKLHHVVQSTIQKLLRHDSENVEEEKQQNEDKQQHFDPLAKTMINSNEASGNNNFFASPTSPSSLTSIGSILANAEKTLSAFTSPDQNNSTPSVVSAQQQQQKSQNRLQTKQEKRKQLMEQKTALQHELETLRKQHYFKKLGIQHKAAEIGRLRNLTENVLPRAKHFCESEGVGEVVRDFHQQIDECLNAAQKRESELRSRLNLFHQQQNQNVNNNSIQNNNNNIIQILEKTYERLEHEKKQKQDLITNFEKTNKNKSSSSTNKIEQDLRTELSSMKQELQSLREKEKFLRHALASDAIRRVLEYPRNQPLQLRGRNAHARLVEAMAFLKAEVVHFGHDVRPVAKALSSRDPENMFKQAHNELKLIVGLTLPKSGEGTAKTLNRKQGQTWPLTHDLLVDRFPQHKIDIAYVKLQEMVVAWDCLTPASQEQLTTAHDVINNAEVLLMFARHVGELHEEKRNQMGERASKIASLSTGESISSSAAVSNSSGNSPAMTSNSNIHHQNVSSRQQSFQRNNSATAMTTNSSRGSSIGVVVTSPSTTPSKQLLLQNQFGDFSQNNIVKGKK